MNVCAVIKLMRDKGMSDSDILDVIQAGLDGERQRSAGAERQARYRERKAQGQGTSVTCDVTSDVTGVSVSQDKERSPEPPKENSTLPTSPKSAPRGRVEYTDLFERFWLAYPSREGADPKKPAAKAFNAAVSRGADPEAIISAAKAHAVQMAGKDARFVPQAVTWLNQDRWQDGKPKIDTEPIQAVFIERGSPQWLAWTKARGKEPICTHHGGKEGQFMKSEWPPQETAA